MSQFEQVCTERDKAVERCVVLEAELAAAKGVQIGLARDIMALGLDVEEARSRLSDTSARWIPVGVRVPCEGETVLAFWYPAAPGNGVSHRNYAKATYLSGGRWVDAEDDDEHEYGTAHFWMPLPVAPK